MMRRTRYLLCTTILFWPLPASAQPLFRAEHNWTVTIGDHLYGLRQLVKTPGEVRWTQIWIGRCTFDTRLRAAEVGALVLRSPADAMLGFGHSVDWSSRRRVP